MQNNTEVIDLSVVVLCYRAEDFVREFTQKLIAMLDKENIQYELILVGNYDLNSNDKTPAIVKLLSQRYPRVIAVTKLKQGMMSWDMRTGFEIAKGKYIAVIDGDGQMPYQDVLSVYHMIKDGKFDLCKTYRVKRYDSLYRQLVSIVYNFVFSIIFYPTPSKDINSKPKIMSREAFNKLEFNSNGWCIDAEIMVQAKRHGFIIGEIPTTFGKITDRGSFVKVSTIFEFIKNIIIFRLEEFKYRKNNK